MKTARKKSRLKMLLCSLGLMAVLSATGCQVNLAGQTLPSPYWLFDDVQYFAPGTEMPLQKEASQMQAHSNQMDAEGL